MNDQERLQFYFNQLNNFYQSLEGVVESSTPLDDFYVDGWDNIFGDGMNFYVKEGNYIKAWELAENLGRLEELKDILEKIWGILPKFYELHRNQGDSVPERPSKWF